MLSQRQYDKLSEEYQTDIAIAEWNGGPIYELRTRDVRKIPDDFKVMILTNFIIRNNIYQPVHRELYRLRNKYGKRNIKESTLYEKAINNVVEQYQIDIE